MREPQYLGEPPTSDGPYRSSPLPAPQTDATIGRVRPRVKAKVKKAPVVAKRGSVLDSDGGAILVNVAFLVVRGLVGV